MSIVPPRQAMMYEPKPVKERLDSQGMSLNNFEKVTLGPGGEMLSHHWPHPVPRKGLTFYDAIQTNNWVKRITLMLLAPLPALRHGLTAFVASFIENYIRLADVIYQSVNRVPYLKYQHYNTTSKALWDISFLFLRWLGIPFYSAYRFGLIVATMLEYDEVYRLPIVDVMSEMNKEEALKSPSRFIKKFMRILAERSDNPSLTGKFKAIGHIVGLLLLIPKYKCAFRKAFEDIDFKLLQYDKYDYYWVLGRTGYNFMGRTLDDRYDEFIYKMLLNYEKLNPGKKVYIKQHPGEDRRIEYFAV